MPEPAPLPIWGVILIITCFPVVFAGFWSFVCWLLSRVGGWGKLARRFRVAPEKAPASQATTTGRLGLARYRGCLHIGCTAEGLHLSVPVIFRPGHPPLLIPWSEIRFLKTYRMLGWVSVAYEIGHPRITTLQLPERALDALPHVPAHLLLP